MPARTLRVGRPNSAYQRIESLIANRRKRHQARTFVVEGVQPINLARANGWQFHGFVYEGGRSLSRWAAGLMDQAPEADRYEVGSNLFPALSGKDEPSELLALVGMPEGDLDRIPRKPDLLVVIVDRPASPGNLGTLIRSADALGAHGVIVTGHGVDLYDRATIAASRGALFSTPVVRVDSHEPVLRWIEQVRRDLGACRLVGADEKGVADLASQDFTGPAVLIFGNEAHGLSHAYTQVCDAMVSIPMVGQVTSLNVGVAASIILYEVFTQRRRD